MATPLPVKAPEVVIIGAYELRQLELGGWWVINPRTSFILGPMTQARAELLARHLEQNQETRLRWGQQAMATATHRSQSRVHIAFIYRANDWLRSVGHRFRNLFSVRRRGL